MNLSFLKFIKTICLKTLTISFFILQFPQTKAQYFNNFNQIKPLYNPSAIWEGEDPLKITSIYRNQWVGFRDQTLSPGQVARNVAPKTFVLNTAFQLQKDSVTPSKWALGIQIMNDRIGYFKTSTAQLQAAYQIPLTKSNSQLIIGIGVGFTQLGLKGGFKFNGNSDSVINSFDQDFDLSTGVFYQKETFNNGFSQFYAGFSINHINSPKFALNFSSTPTFTIYNVSKDFNFITGVNIHTGNPLVILEPAVLLNYNSSLLVQTNLIANYNSTFRCGLGYRELFTTNALSIILGYLNKKLKVGYSYDITLSKIRTVSYGSHEILASYTFGK